MSILLIRCFSQCIDKAMIEQTDKILLRITRFLSAHLKLQGAVITQTDCLNYLKDDNIDKLLLLDVPYISSEHTCGIKGFNYAPFHKKVTEYLQKAEYPFFTFAGVLRAKDTELMVSNRCYSHHRQFLWDDIN